MSDPARGRSVRERLDYLEGLVARLVQRVGDLEQSAVDADGDVIGTDQCDMDPTVDPWWAVAMNAHRAADVPRGTPGVVAGFDPAAPGGAPVFLVTHPSMDPVPMKPHPSIREGIRQTVGMFLRNNPKPIYVPRGTSAPCGPCSPAANDCPRGTSAPSDPASGPAGDPTPRQSPEPGGQQEPPRPPRYAGVPLPPCPSCGGACEPVGDDVACVSGCGWTKTGAEREAAQREAGHRCRECNRPLWSDQGDRCRACLHAAGLAIVASRRAAESAGGATCDGCDGPLGEDVPRGTCEDRPPANASQEPVVCLRCGAETSPSHTGEWECDACNVSYPPKCPCGRWMSHIGGFRWRCLTHGVHAPAQANVPRGTSDASQVPPAPEPPPNKAGRSGPR